MITIRAAIFVFGLFLMALSLLLGLGAWDHPRYGRAFIFDLGLIMAIGAHGWPEVTR